MTERLYFAYGSNMNLHQMDFRCPNASVVGNVRLNDYRLSFGGVNPNRGVATIIPEDGHHVDGVLWKITDECEQSLDYYEGYPRLYGKNNIQVTDENGRKYDCMVYTMNEPYGSKCCVPSKQYLDGILEGCRQNGIDTLPIRMTVKLTEKTVKAEKKKHKER